MRWARNWLESRMIYILALPGEDTALLTNVTIIQVALSEHFEAGRLLFVLEAPNSFEEHLEPTMELPKIRVPNIDGDVLKNIRESAKIEQAKITRSWLVTCMVRIFIVD